MLFVCACASPLAAQTPEAGSGGGQSGDAPPQTGSENGDGSALTRPFRGLFGLDDEGRTGAAISGSLFGAYEDNLAATLPGLQFDPRHQRTGWYSGANTRMSVNWRGERAQVNGWGFAGTRYYPDFDDPFVPSYSAGLGIGLPLGQRNTIRLSQTFQYSPYFLNGFFADVPSFNDPAVVPTNNDPSFDVSGNTIMRSSTVAGVTRRLSRVSSISASYSYFHSNYSKTDRNYNQQYGSVRFTRQLLRHASLRLGYGYRTVASDIGPFEITRSSQDIDAGIDYNRSFALTMTRRTRVSFRTGTSFISRRYLSEGSFVRDRARFYVTGTAELTHEMGRTWRAAAVYRRSAGFNELVIDPIISDSVTASLSGLLLGRRNEFRASASASRGEVANDLNNNSYTGYRALAQLRRGLTRHLAAQVSYVFYKHEFGSNVLLPAAFPHRLDRQGVNFGLNMWFPLH